MSKVRIYEVAKELGMEQKALVALFQSMGFGDVRNHTSSVEPELVERVRRHIEKQKTASTVEERIRPTVVKRRAVGRPDKGETSMPPPPASQAPVSRVSAHSQPAQALPPEPAPMHEPAPASVPPEPASVRPSIPAPEPSRPSVPAAAAAPAEERP